MTPDKHSTQCRHYDNNCGAVHPSNCPDCPFRVAQAEAKAAPAGDAHEAAIKALLTKWQTREPGQYAGYLTAHEIVNIVIDAARAALAAHPVHQVTPDQESALGELIQESQAMGNYAAAPQAVERLTDAAIGADLNQRAAQEAVFSTWFCENYPRGTEIFRPEWHAPIILRAARAALTATPPALPESEDDL